ncbi:unnamed protein product [Absidia cylindrospora]
MMTSNSNNNNNHSNSQFNAAPILLRHPSSFMIDNNLMYQQDSKNYHPTSPLYESEPTTVLDDVPQRLEPEQYQYEFPPKSHLQALSMQLDQSIEDSISFFDASSFTTTTCTTSSTTSSSRVSSVVTDDFNAQEDQEFNSFLATLELEQYQQQQVVAPEQQEQTGFSLSPPPIESEEPSLVHDRQLSPLQLPQQAASQMAMMTSSTRVREESYDSISTITQPIVAPASFLSHHQQVNDDNDDDEYEQPGYHDQIEWHDTFGTNPSIWQDNFNDSYDSIHPHHRLSEDQDLPIIRRESEMVLSDSDNSMMMDDDDNSNFSAGSKVVLFKLNKKNKLASPYMPKRTTTSYTSSSDEGYDDDYDDDKELPIESASVFLPLDHQQAILDDDYHHQDDTTAAILKQQQAQIDRLESQLREEKAMRTAFEKAMEEMVLLMDQQQKMLYDRVEQEVAMRQLYEKKMDDALTLVTPLEHKLKKETDARCELESMMSHVLGELQEIKSTQQQQQAASSLPVKNRSTTTTASSTSSRTNVNVKRTKVPSSRQQTPTTTTTTLVTRPAATATKPASSSINDKRSVVNGSSQRLRSQINTTKSSLTKKQPLFSKSSRVTPSSRLLTTTTTTTTSRPPPPSIAASGRKRQF